MEIKEGDLLCSKDVLPEQRKPVLIVQDVKQSPVMPNLWKIETESTLLDPRQRHITFTHNTDLADGGHNWMVLGHRSTWNWGENVDGDEDSSDDLPGPDDTDPYIEVDDELTDDS